MIGKIIGTLILGGGLGIPLSATLRKTIVSERIPRILETSDSVIKIEWDKKDSHKKIGEIIDGLGKVINPDKKDLESVQVLHNTNKKPKVLAVRLSTKGAFKDDICKRLGFDPGLKEPPINLKDKSKIKDDDIKGIGCYTNLDI